jgi:hypothetical protein
MAGTSAGVRKGWISRRLHGAKQAGKAFLGIQSLGESRASTGAARKINRVADAIGRMERRVGNRLMGKRP